MTRKTRRNVLAALTATTTVGLAGCNSSGEDDGGDTTTAMTTTTEGTDGGRPSGTAGVRVAHFSPDAPNVDVYVDGSQVLSDVAFGTVSSYLQLPTGTYPVEITAAGDPDTVAFEGDIQFEERDYTVAAVGELSGDDTEFRPLVLEDDNSEPAEDTARVRLVHASPDAPAVDVTLASNGDAVYDGIAFRESGYVEVPAGTYTLQVRGDTAGNDGDVVGQFTVELAGGTVYTGFAGGYLTPGDDPGDPAFDLTLAVDAGAGGGGRIEPSFLRVAHFSPDAPDVDVYVDDARVLSGVPFRAVSDYLQLAPGEHAVEITAAGDPDTVAFEGTVSLDPGPYTVAAVGELSGDDAEFRPLVLEDDNSDPGEDTARVRLVHASPDAPAVDVTLATKGDVVYDGVAFGESGYVEVPAGTYTLQVRGDTAGNDGDVVAKYTVQLAGGTVYTGFAGGYLTPGDDPADEPFDLTFAVDAGADTGTSGSAFLRVAHLSPDAPNVDVYLDDSRVLSDVPFRTISDYLELSPGQYLLEITPAGNPDNVVFQSMLRLEPGPYTVIATGELSDDDTRLFPPKLVRDDNSDPGEDTARVRLVHASPDAPAVDVTLASNGEAVFDGVAFDEISTAEVPAGTYTLQVRGDTEGNDGDVVAEFEVTLDGGSVYSAFAVGYLTPGDEPVEEPFGLKLVRDAQN